MKQQLRKLKLYELGITEWPYATSYETMRSLVDQNLDGCVIKTSDEYPNSYFFVQGDRCVMEQDKKNDVLWVRFEDYWSIFSNDFSLQYDDIQAIIKFLVEQHLRSKVGTPVKSTGCYSLTVEQHLRSKVGTPKSDVLAGLVVVEQHLRSKVGTPSWKRSHETVRVEQHLRSKVGTPH